MFIAVSTLSPVSTHTFIPAFLKLSIVSPTPSYNLSSIAVEPIRLKFISNNSAVFSIYSSLFDTDIFAS